MEQVENASERIYYFSPHKCKWYVQRNTNCTADVIDG